MNIKINIKILRKIFNCFDAARKKTRIVCDSNIKYPPLILKKFLRLLRWKRIPKTQSDLAGKENPPRFLEVDRVNRL